MLGDIFLYNDKKLTKNLWIYFSAVFLVNFAFKIINLDYSSFWYDEIISVQSASLDFGHIKHVSEWDKNPPFYYYCLSVWIKLFNDSEFCVRLLSVIFSSLAGGMLFIVCNKLFNKITAISASIFFLSSNVLFFYSHEARAYSLVLFLALISTYLYFSLKENPNFKNVILLGLVNFLLIYTHYVSGLVILFQSLLMLFFFNKNQKIKYGFSLLLLIGLVFLRFTKKQLLLIVAFNNSENTFWLKTSDFNYLLEVIDSFMLNSGYFSFLFILIVVLILVALRHESYKDHLPLIYFVSIGLCSVIFLYIAGKFSPLFLDRYIIFSIPFILSIVAFGLSLIKNKYIPVIISILFFVICSFNMDFKTEKNMDYRNAVAYIKSIKQANDLIIVKTKDIKPLFCYYYDKDYLSQQKTDLPQSENIIFCDSWADVNKNSNDFNRVIVVDSFQDLNPNENEFVSNLSKLKTISSTTESYKGVKISFYK